MISYVWISAKACGRPSKVSRSCQKNRRFWPMYDKSDITLMYDKSDFINLFHSKTWSTRDNFAKVRSRRWNNGFVNSEGVQGPAHGINALKPPFGKL
jgi:hypothetical protein